MDFQTVKNWPVAPPVSLVPLQNLTCAHPLPFLIIILVVVVVNIIILIVVVIFITTSFVPDTFVISKS